MAALSKGNAKKCNILSFRVTDAELEEIAIASKRKSMQQFLHGTVMKSIKEKNKTPEATQHG